MIEELGGQATPAVGLATGIERIVLNLKRQNIAVPPVPQPQVFVAFVGEAARLKSKEIVTQLRRAGVSTEQALGNKSLKAQFRHANALGAKFTLLLGDDELRQGIAILRDMSTSEQRPVPQDKLVSELKPLIDR